MLADPDLATAQWGLLVRSVDRRHTACAIQADKQFTPASTVKLLTAAAALATLGPEFRFATRLLPLGPVRDGVLEGDLAIVGDGDPTLDTSFLQDPEAIFRDWARELQRQGITRIAGKLVGIDACPPAARLGDGWAVDDLPHAYAAAVGTLQVHRNAVAAPTVAGEAPARRTVAVADPATFYLETLQRVWRENGLPVAGGVAVADRLPIAPAAPPLVTRLSPPLLDILAVALRDSVNLYAETVVRAIGQQAAGEFGFATGKAVVQEVLAGMGVPATAYRYADGSGLSRYNCLSPDQLVTVLTAMLGGGGRTAALWRELLPVAGAGVGTLGTRLLDTPLAGNLRAKTGSMSNIRALAGIFTAASGREYAFAILVNGHLAPPPTIDCHIDQILLLLHDRL